MDANQLAEAIARAVELAKPAQEYCFLWIDWWPMCMTKAEWSGWMQAIGSALALAIAIGLPSYQKRKAEAENYAMARQCVVYQGAALAAISALGGPDVAQTLRGSGESIATLRRMYAEVRPSQLPQLPMYAWLTAQTTAGHLFELTQQLGVRTIPDPVLRQSVQRFLDVTVQALQAFSDHDAKTRGRKPEQVPYPANTAPPAPPAA